MATPNYLGTANGLTGIPSLLISTLQQIDDPKVQTALYQIQNWANSFFTQSAPPRFTGLPTTPMAGTPFGPTASEKILIQGDLVQGVTTNSAGQYTVTLPTPFPNTFGWVDITDISNNSAVNQWLGLYAVATVTLSTFTVLTVVNAAPLNAGVIDFMYTAYGA